MAGAIVSALKQSETGVAEVCRKMGISEATYYNWKKKYGGLGVAELHRLRQLEPGRPLGLWAGNIPRFGSLPAVNQSRVHYRVAEESKTYAPNGPPSIFLF